MTHDRLAAVGGGAVAIAAFFLGARLGTRSEQREATTRDDAAQGAQVLVQGNLANLVAAAAIR